jgi:hypothetical protein
MTNAFSPSWPVRHWIKRMPWCVRRMRMGFARGMGGIPALIALWAVVPLEVAWVMCYADFIDRRKIGSSEQSHFQFGRKARFPSG